MLLKEDHIQESSYHGAPALLSPVDASSGGHLQALQGWDGVLLDVNVTSRKRKHWAPQHLVNRPDLVVPAQSFTNLLATFTPTDVPFQQMKKYADVRSHSCRTCEVPIE